MGFKTIPFGSLGLRRGNTSSAITPFLHRQAIRVNGMEHSLKRFHRAGNIFLDLLSFFC
jgi:hypothetical protein